MDHLTDDKPNKPKPPLTREEYFELITPYIVNSDAPFRLDVIYSAEKNQVIVQGDENGLRTLIESILSVARPHAMIGEHTHFDKDRLTYSNIELIIQRVNPYDDEGINHKP